ncbi:MAG: hypothetical protein AAF939_01915 [Planctomycetota bacterium]
MDQNNCLPSGEWNGFYLEGHRTGKGWMHLYLSFEDGIIRGEGTDYVGPWVATGSYDVDKKIANWVKQYVGKHQVEYRGKIVDQGIVGQWSINFISGEFHIWPISMGYLNELYLREDLEIPDYGQPLGTVPSLEVAFA